MGKGTWDGWQSTHWTLRTGLRVAPLSNEFAIGWGRPPPLMTVKGNDDGN